MSRPIIPLERGCSLVRCASLFGETAFAGWVADNDDRNVAHEMLTRLDKSNPDVGLQQMIKMLRNNVSS